MIVKRYCAVLISLVGLCLGAAAMTYAQEASITLETSATSQARNAYSSFADGYNVACRVTSWIEGEWSPWLYAYVYLNVGETQVGYEQDFGYWYVSAAASTYVSVSPYLQSISCTGDTLGGYLYASAEILGRPDGETTQSDGWADAEGGPTIHKWLQTLTPTDASYNGRWTLEQDGGGGNDTCWFPGSIYARFDAITGGEWPVSGNVWGPDYVGWGPEQVEYYRDEGRQPCGTDFYQNMLIDFPDGWGEYQVNALSTGFTDNTVWSYRNGQFAERIWFAQPAPSPRPTPRPTSGARALTPVSHWTSGEPRSVKQRSR